MSLGRRWEVWWRGWVCSLGGVGCSVEAKERHRLDLRIMQCLSSKISTYVFNGTENVMVVREI